MLRRGAHLACIYARLQVLHLRAHLEYEADFWIGIVGSALMHLAGYVFVWSLFSRVQTIGGWQLWEVAFLYGLVIIPRGLVELLCDGPWMLRRLVSSGEFDRLLLRPIPPVLQVIAQVSSIHGFGGVLLGGAIIVRATQELGHGWDPARLAFLALTLASGTLIVGSVNLATNAIAFWEPAATSAFPYMVVQLVEFAKYPISLYGRFVQVLVTWMLPCAFISYYPGLVLLGKPAPEAWLGWLAPVAALATALIAGLVWRRGLLRYQGTGH